MTSSANKFAAARALALTGLGKDILTARLASDFTLPTPTAVGTELVSLLGVTLRANSLYAYEFQCMFSNTAICTIGLGMDYGGAINAMTQFVTMASAVNVATYKGVVLNGYTTDNASRAAGGASVYYPATITGTVSTGASTGQKLFPKAQVSAATGVMKAGSFLCAWEI